MKLHEWQKQQKKAKRLPPQGGRNMKCFYYEAEGKVNRELFNEIAEEIAKDLSEADKIEKAQEKMQQNNYKEAKKILESIKSTATTQIRKYYDELRRFRTQMEQAHNQQERQEKFEKLLPSIKMLRAKIMYAKGRGVVTDNFVNFMNKNVSFIKSEKDLEKFLLFCRHFEAVLGFLKYYEELKKQLLDIAKEALRQQRQRRR